jgi:hypothetical protein
MRWEYEKIDLNSAPSKTDDLKVLNDAGRAGWELVAILANNIAYLKRPLAAAKQAANCGSVRAASGG